MTHDILGIKYAIKFRKKVVHDEQVVAGLCDFEKKQILINVTYPATTPKKEIARQISRTFWHEIFHAFCFEAGFRDQSYWNEDIEHFIISFFEILMAKNYPVQIEIKTQ